MILTATKARARLGNAMTVADLIDELSHMDPAALVVFQSDYGDYTHTQQVTPVGNADEYDPDVQRLYDSAYSNSEVAVKDLDEDDEDEDRETEPHDHADLAVVILS